MVDYLCITFRFIQPLPEFHGRGDADIPEWPPSPLRAIQALLRAAAMREPGAKLSEPSRAALTLLERTRPEIVAPVATVARVGRRAYVPHNHADLVAAAWRRGTIEASIASHRMEKDMRPMRVEVTNGELPAVHYLYALGSRDEHGELLRTVRPIARSVVALGWGIDQVIGNAHLVTAAEAADLTGVRWRPAVSGGGKLRVHRPGTLEALCDRYRAFKGRLVEGNFTPVPPLTEMDLVSYRTDSEPRRPFAVFRLLDSNDDAYRYPHAKLIHVAGMMRHTAIERMKQDSPPWIKTRNDWIESFIAGHRRDENHLQLSYVPLPSIGHAHSDALIRNIMIIAPVGHERELDFLTRRLDGDVLTPEVLGDGPPATSDRTATLSQFSPPPGKFIATRYLGTSRTWHTVTPVILPGHDDKKESKTERLIQKALAQSGIETRCSFAWQSIPFLKNCLSAHKYDRNGRFAGYHRPAHLKELSAVHLHLTFDHPVSGPVTIGAGRHCGLGLFAAADAASSD